MKKFIIILFFLLTVAIIHSSQRTYAQNTEIKPVTLGQQMPDFTLPIYGGGELNFSSLKGKNVLLVFLRGYAGIDHWCNICNYQYAELADIEKKENIRKKYNLEIVFVLPYTEEKVKEWAEKLPDQLADIEKWKNPAEPEKQTEKQKNWTEYAKKTFTKKFDVKKGEVSLPVLIDAEKKLSKGLGLFMTEWNNAKVEQDIPTVYIIDKTGKVEFKYISQNTIDRPKPDYLLTFIDKMIR